MPTTAAPVLGTARPQGQRARAVRHPGWPLTALLVPYPLWWALGMGTLIVFVLAAPMVIHLWRRRPVAVPPGFGLWVLFLLWVALSGVMLGVDPPGTLPGEAGDRVISFVFNIAAYSVVAVVLLYFGNLTEEEFPRRKLVRQLAGLFMVTVAGGLLGTYASDFQFTSPVEAVLPASVASNTFVQSIVHPAAAQVQDLLGYASGRPAAPFGYTNMWGYCLSLLLGFFAITWLRGSLRRRLTGVVVLGLAAIPAVHSLNRGLWIALAVTVVFALVWLARNGHLAAIGAVVVGVVVAGVLVANSPLTGVVSDRLDNQKSNGIRAFTIEKTLEVVPHSPVIGFGANRRSLGSSNSIAVGRTTDCTNCGNPVLGNNGQLWQLLIGQGAVGTLLYLLFFARIMLAYRRDKTPLAGAAMLAVFLPFVYMFLYNALAIPLLITFLAIGLLWRNARQREADEAAAAGPPAPALTGTGVVA